MISRYLKDKRKIIFGYLSFVFIFVVVCGLYQLDNLTRILYAALITGFIGGCLMVFDFGKYCRHYKMLCRIAIKAGEEVAPPDILPPPADALQEEYQNRIGEMQAAFQEVLSGYRQNESERMDYYLMWAHQIKTPIAAIKLLLQNGPADAFLMEKELFKIESYVEMVLHYLRLESISSDMLLKSYDVYEMVKKAVKKYSLLFIDGNIGLHLSEFTKEIITDEKWFSFVLEQLLSNGVKYTPAGEIFIYMEEDCLVVADTGIGIRAEDLPRIFERGFTGYNGRMNQKSTGIGLYLCGQVSRRLGISLKVTSRQGEGTTVRLYFAAK